MISAQDRRKDVELIKEANANGARLAKACEVLDISTRTYERWNKAGDAMEDGRPKAKRPTPKNKLTEEERQEVLETVNQREYASLPPSQIVPDLADKGIYIASESTFYRILRENNQQHHRGWSKRPVTRQPVTHIATAPNQVWSWDISWVPGPAQGIFYRLYMVIDIFSRLIVSWEIWEKETAEYASELIKKAVVSEKIKGRPLVLHSDNGSPMKAATFLVLLDKLGVSSSFSRPRVSNDNPYSESLFRTCKYRPDYPYKGFESMEKAREWMSKFVYWYNEKHRHSGLQFVTPRQRHDGLANEILRQRRLVYKKAQLRHPERWSRDIRSWELAKESP